MDKRILIVGAGISGLSAGIYARFNGYPVSIFEMHGIPGGLCTAWERKGYRFDISMHMLTGSDSGPFHQMWKELGVVPKFRFHRHDHATQVEGMGKKLLFSADRQKLEKALLEISPQDGELIREFTRLIFGRDMMKAATLKPRKLENIGDKIRMFVVILPLFRTLARYNRVTIQQFSERFRNPFLREVVRFVVDAPGWPMPGFPMTAMPGFMRTGISEAGVPLGGSQEVVFHLAELFKELGGELHLNSRVSDLIRDQA
jgi:phytoene dehydrogenase-like protein